MDNTIKLTKSTRLFMVFSAITTAKKPWTRDLDPEHPFVVLDFEKRHIQSTTDGTDAIDSWSEDTWETIKEICNKIK